MDKNFTNWDIMNYMKKYNMATNDTPILQQYDLITDSPSLNFIFDKIIKHDDKPGYYEITYERYIKDGEFGKEIDPTSRLTPNDKSIARNLIQKYILNTHKRIDTINDKLLTDFFTYFVNWDLPLTASWRDLYNKYNK